MGFKSIHTEKVLGRDVYFCEGLEDINNTVWELWADRALTAIENSGEFNIAMQGSVDLAPLIDSIVDNYDYQVWHFTKFFLLNDLYLPITHLESIARMIKERLVDVLGLELKNFNFIPFAPTLHRSVTKYAADLRKYLGLSRDQLPAFDMVLLKLGESGTIAPFELIGSDEKEKVALVESFHNSQSNFPSISMTMPVINNAKSIVIISQGSKANESLKRWLEGTESGPISKINSDKSEFLIVSDVKPAELDISQTC